MQLTYSPARPNRRNWKGEGKAPRPEAAGYCRPKHFVPRERHSTNKSISYPEGEQLSQKPEGREEALWYWTEHKRQFRVSTRMNQWHKN